MSTPIEPPLDPRAVELLRKVQQHLRDWPNEYNQDIPNASCGTPCCIIGRARAIRNCEHAFTCDKLALDVWLTVDQLDRLYWANQWPKKFFDGNGNSAASVRLIPASVAIARIDHFIATDGKE